MAYGLVGATAAVSLIGCSACSPYVFAIQLGWLPAGGTVDVRATDPGFVDPAHLILLAVTLAITQQSWFTLYVRDTLLELLRDDYVRFAEASGVRRAAVLDRHALPNALIPFVTLTGTHISELIGGAVLAETIFGWPGVGRLTVRAALVVDLPLLVAITLIDLSDSAVHCVLHDRLRC